MLRRKLILTQVLFSRQPCKLKPFTSDGRHHFDQENEIMIYKVRGEDGYRYELKGLAHDCDLWLEQGNPQVRSVIRILQMPD